jgi:hypothetical protein
MTDEEWAELFTRQSVAHLAEQLDAILPAGNEKITALARLDDVLTLSLAALGRLGG